MNATQLEIFNEKTPSFSLDTVQFRFVDLFSGIGGFRIPLEELGGRCAGYSEIDKEALKVYRNNFLLEDAEEPYLGDITQVESLPPNVDLIVGGVPCQPWSVAGKLKGFQDPRGQLWFDVIRLVRDSKPKAFIFENVRGLANPKNRKHLDTILEELRHVNYTVSWQVINSYDFGVPQNRERIFIVGIRKDLRGHQNYRFPSPVDYNPKLTDIIADIQDIELPEKAKISPEVLFGGAIPPSRNRFQKDDELNDFFVFSDLRNGHTTVHSWDLQAVSDREEEICLALLRNRRRKRYGHKDGNPLSFEDFRELLPHIEPDDIDGLIQKGIFRAVVESEVEKYDFVNSKNSAGIDGVYRVFLPQSEMIPTLTATGNKDFIATEAIHADNPRDYKRLFLEKIYKERKFRPIAGQDARSLQGFPSWFRIHPVDRTAKKQFGNAVSVPAVFHIAHNLIAAIADDQP